MIDIHSHLLPGIDDGAGTLQVSLAMARIAESDGISDMVCTPHIYPGMYENDASGIRQGVVALQARLDDAGLSIRLHSGADAHLTPELSHGVANGRVPTLAGSRYLLLEPPHHVAPPRFEATVFGLMAQGLVPVITHPERLSWVESHYELFERLVERGCWMQITAGALTGRFGRRVRYWGERFVSEGRAHVLATDAHNADHRPPLLHEARVAAERLVGVMEATHLVETRPSAILADLDPGKVPLPEARSAFATLRPSWLPRWLS